MSRIYFLMIVALCTVTSSFRAFADSGAPSNFLVVGVISSTNPAKGVALMKNTVTQAIFAAKVGADLGEGAKLSAVLEHTVQVRIGAHDYLLRIGDDLNTTRSIANSNNANSAVTFASGIEREGNTVKLAASTRDALVNNNLNAILMQAASEPYYQDGHLAGFKLFDIDHASVYDQAGIQNGDIVTAINGQAINDPVRTIQLLSSLKQEPKITIDILRGGAPRTMSLVVTN